MGNIPIPNHPRFYKYPWEDLKVPGDSFFRTLTQGQRHGMHRGANQAGMKIICRKRIEDGVTGYRVWRVK